MSSLAKPHSISAVFFALVTFGTTTNIAARPILFSFFCSPTFPFLVMRPSHQMGILVGSLEWCPGPESKLLNRV